MRTRIKSLRIRSWLILLALASIGALFALSFVSSRARAEDPIQQPINFPHNWHVVVVGLDCLFCHRTAATSDAANIPPIGQCFFCHQVAGHQSAEVQKILTAVREQQPINWVRVYRLPDIVRFTHEPHYRAGIDCATCHGDVSNMTVARQDRPLKMGDCVGCHRQKNAPTDCFICHY